MAQKGLSNPYEIGAAASDYMKQFGLVSMGYKWLLMLKTAFLKLDEDDFYKNKKDIAILKIRAGAAAGKVIAISHQVHGAIGFTQEYELAYFTRNLNSWRNDFGNESYWEEFLGKDFLENNNQNLWEYLT